MRRQSTGKRPIPSAPRAPYGLEIQLLDKSDRECVVCGHGPADEPADRLPGMPSQGRGIGAGEVVIHNAIIKVDTPTGRVTAKCPRCKSWVEVPLKYVG